MNGCKPTNPICVQLSKRGPRCVWYFGVYLGLQGTFKSRHSQDRHQVRPWRNRCFAWNFRFVEENHVSKKPVGLLGVFGLQAEIGKEMFFCRVVAYSSKNYVPPNDQMVFNLHIQSFKLYNRICRKVFNRASSFNFQAGFLGGGSRNSIAR